MILRGLYAITAGDATLAHIEQVLRGGVQCLQYRYKEAAQAPEPREVARLCRAYGTLFIINDDVALAKAVGADGVHVGRDDTSLRAARASLGKDAIIGVSCYDDLERARAAAGEGADYVAFGRFYPSATKPLAVQAPLTILRQARDQFAVPIVAIGGITPDNAKPLIDAGADMVAVIDALFGTHDGTLAAQRFQRLFNEYD